MTKDKKQKPHYVNNKEFSLAVVDYVKDLQEKRNNKEDLPPVTDYIASCFMKIAERLSSASNFARYTYREEMVMDGVENCLKAIENYNIEAATRSGNPNAFAYFTQIIYYAFLRRIAKEKKQQDIKLKYIAEGSISDFMDMSADTSDMNQAVSTRFIDTLKERISNVKTADEHFSTYLKKHKRKRSTVQADSDLTKIL